ncbi:hypothetical protein NCCP28_25390 [Niallia sp. NCCP-28]|nr:hypothetical protein NCCP28_25390 [Niallia sp. NCCP-28]
MPLQTIDSFLSLPLSSHTNIKYSKFFNSLFFTRKVFSIKTGNICKKGCEQTIIQYNESILA